MYTLIATQIHTFPLLFVGGATILAIAAILLVTRSGDKKIPD